VLSFGRLLSEGQPIFDELPASPVRLQEAKEKR
jgi:hypothetical protein